MSGDINLDEWRHQPLLHHSCCTSGHHSSAAVSNLNSRCSHTIFCSYSCMLWSRYYQDISIIMPMTAAASCTTTTTTTTTTSGNSAQSEFSVAMGSHQHPFLSIAIAIAMIDQPPFILCEEFDTDTDSCQWLMIILLGTGSFWHGDEDVGCG